MAKLKIELTDDLISLISNIKFKEVPEPLTDNDTREYIEYAIDYNSLYGGDFVFEDISYILGRYEEHVPGTEEDALGPRFPKELEDYMWDLHSYILENIDSIEEIVHQFCGKGGIKAGTYECNSYFRQWERIG